MSITLGRFLDDLAVRHGDRTAWWYGGTSGSFADLAARSRRVAGGLARLGIGPGDRILLWLPNGPAWLSVFFGAARLGAVVFCANTRFRQREMADLIGRGRVGTIVLWPGFKGLGFLDILAAADPAAFDRVRHVVLYASGAARPAASAGRPRQVGFADWRHRRRSQAATVTRAASTTSGTTGRPSSCCTRTAR
jgi:fatty-acyl-CoA synthase